MKSLHYAIRPRFFVDVRIWYEDEQWNGVAVKLPIVVNGSTRRVVCDLIQQAVNEYFQCFMEGR